MNYYQHIRDGRPMRRYTFECVESCHLGTDDPEEFASHIASCEHVLPQIRRRVQLALDRGETVAAKPEPAKEATGQGDLWRA